MDLGSENSTELLINEAKQHNDIIQWNFTDTYKSASIRMTMLTLWHNQKLRKCRTENDKFKISVTILVRDTVVFPELFLKTIYDLNLHKTDKIMYGYI